VVAFAVDRVDRESGQRPTDDHSIGAQSVTENMPMEPVLFAVSDAETAAGLLTVTATSSNQTIVPDANLTLLGNGTQRNIAAMPLVGVRGETTITLTVTERTYYLAEGATSVFFSTDILLANPNTTAAPVVTLSRCHASP
jgi:hypothetical protein